MEIAFKSYRGQIKLNALPKIISNNYSFNFLYSRNDITSLCNSVMFSWRISESLTLLKVQHKYHCCQAFWLDQASCQFVGGLGKRVAHSLAHNPVGLSLPLETRRTSNAEVSWVLQYKCKAANVVKEWSKAAHAVHLQWISLKITFAEVRWWTPFICYSVTLALL